MRDKQRRGDILVIVILPVIIVLIMLFAVSCSVAPYTDLSGVPVQDPDQAYILRNADRFPNLSILCFDGTAVVTTTREAAPVIEPMSTLCDLE